MEFEAMLTPREKSPLLENVPRGGSNPRHRGQRAHALPTELFRPRVAFQPCLVLIKANLSGLPATVICNFNCSVPAYTIVNADPSLCGWCMLGGFLLPAFTSQGHESQDLLSLCNGIHVCTD